MSGEDKNPRVLTIYHVRSHDNKRPKIDCHFEHKKSAIRTAEDWQARGRRISIVKITECLVGIWEAKEVQP